MPVYHLLAFIELVFLPFFYYKLLSAKPIYLYGLGVLILFNFLHTLLTGDLYKFNQVAWSINALVFIILGFVYYYQLYEQSEPILVEKHPMFFINAGILVYASGSFFTYLLGWEILSKEASGIFHNAWIIQSFSNVAKNIIIAYGLWLSRQM
ncbi:hypothetical protein QNI16_25860 [Cytophagaceae bacterium YF14B1]|uniref:Uncharacterized protein n=1 Tax=Xanthocytophaga flava TaxID=3048013 RepID=A0AAE3UB23_9BACT|nr:hypothetical protein [Xanthocytophaga flavus]MDJ1483948.1 hypothetical protein [Xanthocytophaga flavus]